MIAVMNKSVTHANPNSSFDWRRPDAHTIDITDDYNRHVLHVRFANPHTLVVEGMFQFSDGRTLTRKPEPNPIGCPKLHKDHANPASSRCGFTPMT